MSNRYRKIEALDEFLKVFGEDYGTAQVLTTPSERDKKIALELVNELSTDLVLRDLAIIAAREVANVLESNGMRAADYADVADLPEKVAGMIKAKIGSEYFLEALRDHLRGRG